MSGDSDMSEAERLLGNQDDPELNNFLSRVGEITQIIQGLASDDQKDNERAIRQADILLHDGDGSGTFDEALPCKVTSNRTLINKAPEPSTCDQGDMPQDAFMKMVEKDAGARAKDRKERKKKSDELRTKGNEAFKKGNYAEALDTYNKAIGLIKDSPCLYTNRALTYIRIGIHSKAIDDCEQAIYINPDLLKPRLLKSRACFNMAQADRARAVLHEARKLFPEQEKMIDEYENDIFELKLEKHLEVKSEEKRRKEKESQESDEKPEAEEIWRKAARHELGQEEDISDTATTSS